MVPGQGRVVKRWRAAKFLHVGIDFSDESVATICLKSTVSERNRPRRGGEERGRTQGTGVSISRRQARRNYREEWQAEAADYRPLAQAEVRTWPSPQRLCGSWDRVPESERPSGW